MWMYMSICKLKYLLAYIYKLWRLDNNLYSIVTLYVVPSVYACSISTYVDIYICISLYTWVWFILMYICSYLVTFICIYIGLSIEINLYKSIVLHITLYQIMSIISSMLIHVYVYSCIYFVYLPLLDIVLADRHGSLFYVLGQY